MQSQEVGGKEVIKSVGRGGRCPPEGNIVNFWVISEYWGVGR